MKQRLLTMLLALVAIMMPIGAWAYYEPKSVPIKIGTSGVATLYYGAHNLVIPEGVSASVITITGVEVNEVGTVTVTEQVVDNIIPADCAVILRGESGSYEFLIEEAPVEVPELNLLRGTDEETKIGEKGYLYFYLPEDSESSDWIYVGNEITIGAHKACLALPVDDYPKLAAMLGALENPHLQHTHGGCDICDQVTVVEAAWGASIDALTSYGTLAEAVDAAGEEDSNIGYIKLLADVEDDIYVEGGNFTLDLNGKTLQSSTTTLNINGGNVTFTDGSEKQTGKVATTSEGAISVCVESGNPTITIIGGQYEAVNREALEICSGSVTIRGGQFTTAGLDQIVSVVDSDEANPAPSLTIMGGTFVAQNVNQIMYMDGNTTISGGTFVGGNNSTVWCVGGTLSFVATEATDETPGFSPMGLRVEYCAEASINLPDGYGIYNENEEPQSELVTNMVYYIGKTGGVSYTVTFSANYDTEATMDDAIVTSPTGKCKYDLPECDFIAPEGKMFKAWLVGGVEYQPGEVIYVTSDTEVKAVWAVPNIVSFDANGGGGVIDAIQTSSNVTLPECTFTAPEGKMFKAWLVDGAEYQPYEMITVSADTEVKAVWAVPYIVSFDANGGESDMDMDAIVTLSDATLPECDFAAPEGMMFKAWLVDGVEYQPYEMITVSADTEVKAVWTEYVPQIVIKMEDTAGDSWNGNAIVVKQNGEVVGTATIIEDRVAATAKFDYDASCEYSFYWDLPELEEGTSWPQECSFEIYVEGELVFAATTDNCAGFEDNQLLHTISVSTISEVSIADGTLTEYSNSQNLCVGTLTYTRTLPNLTWNALYVPFEIPVTEEFLSKYDVAYINDVHSYDTDDNGTIDNMEMELIKIKSGTLRANYPYLIKAKSEEDKELTLEFTDATLFSTIVRNSVYCSSAFTEFHICGTYEQMAKDDIMEICNSYDGETRAGLVVAGDGSWKSMAEGAVLNPFRLYMVMVTSGDSPVKVDPAAFSRVRIRIQGEGGETGIEVVETTVDGKQPTVIYDLMGRRVAVPQKGTIYVVNGKKVMWK